MSNIDNPVEYLAEHIYAGFGARTPWSQAHDEVRALARKDAESALDGMRILAKLQPSTTARMLGLTNELEARQ